MTFDLTAMRKHLPKDLRLAASTMAETGNTFPTGQGIMNDAADEIERLTSALATARNAKNLFALVDETRELIKMALKDGAISDRWAWCFVDTVEELDKDLAIAELRGQDYE